MNFDDMPLINVVKKLLKHRKRIKRSVLAQYCFKKKSQKISKSALFDKKGGFLVNIWVKKGENTLLRDVSKVNFVSKVTKRDFFGTFFF